MTWPSGGSDEPVLLSVNWLDPLVMSRVPIFLLLPDQWRRMIKWMAEGVATPVALTLGCSNSMDWSWAAMNTFFTLGAPRPIVRAAPRRVWATANPNFPTSPDAPPLGAAHNSAALGIAMAAIKANNVWPMPIYSVPWQNPTTHLTLHLISSSYTDLIDSSPQRGTWTHLRPSVD